VSSRALFFVAPEASTEGLPGDAFPNEEKRDAVPSRARDASACARQDKKDTRQDVVGNFFEQPQRQLRSFQEICSRPFIVGSQAKRSMKNFKNKSRLLVVNPSNFRLVALNKFGIFTLTNSKAFDREFRQYLPYLRRPLKP
jgi:hypothetical protein